MKHKYVRFFVLPIVSLLLFSCSTSEKKEDIFDGTDVPVVEHQHTYSDSWSNNNQTHWHAATCEHTELRKDEAVHDFDVKETPATFEKQGQRVYTCKVCHFSRTEGIPKLTHEYSSDWEHDHYSHWHVCIDEGYENIRKDLADHVYVENITEPTFEEDGIKETTCSVCGYSYSVSIPKLTHSYSESWDKDEHGHWHHCIDEGFTDDIVDYAVHNFKEETTNPTYEEAGRTTYTCKECGYSYYVEIDPVEHKFSDKFASDEEGHWHPCTDKGYETLKSGYEEHNFSSEVVAPTYTEEGYTVHTCEECGYKYIDEPVDKLDHHYSDKWVNDAWGHWHVCSDEGYDDLKVDYESHNYDSEITVEPTVYEDGVEKYTCEECGFSYTKKIPSYYKQCIDCCEYQLINNSYYQLYKVPSKISVVYVADEYNGLPVRSMSSYCLHSGVTELHMGKNVNSVYTYELSDVARNIEVVELSDNFSSFPFYTYNLTKLREVYAGTCSYIDFNSFSSIQSFEKLNISDKNDYYTQVDDVIYSKDMSTLCFYPRNKEGDFTVPDSVISIGQYAFSYSKITSIDLSRVQSLSEYAFSDCKNLVSVILPEYEQNYIGYCVFNNCTNLEEVTINANPWSYYDDTFRDCNNISTINIGKNVSYYCSAWFEYGNVTKINVEEGNSYYFATDDYLMNLSQDNIFMCLDKTSTNITLPDFVTYIAAFAFANCAIESINLKNVSSMDRGCFSNCVNLKQANLSNLNGTYFSKTFYNCQSIQKVILPNGRCEITDYCFYNCTSLEEVVGLEECINVDRNCFTNCDSLIHSNNNVRYVGNLDNPYLVAIGFEDGFAGSNRVEFVDECKIVAANAFNVWREVALQEVYLNNVETVCYGAFQSSQISSIDFGSALKFIGGYAFAYCYFLSSVVLPNTVLSIQYWAFGYCNTLFNVYIPSSVNYLSMDAFMYDFSLTNFVVDENNENYFTYKNGLYSVPERRLIFELSFSNSIIVKEDSVYTDWYFLDGRAYSSSGYAYTIFYEFDEYKYSSGAYYEYNTSYLNSPNRYFYSETFASNCWHYVEGVPTLW